MTYTEEQLGQMASPISKSEDERCRNAINMVKDALQNINYTADSAGIKVFAEDTYSYELKMHSKAKNIDITILVQGSYANKTNISSESDVDVAVILESTFRSDYREGVTRDNYGFTPATYSAKELKNDVYDALQYHFKSGVKRSNKCIEVRGNSYRVDVDVVPSSRYRDYRDDYRFDASNYVRGVAIYPDDGDVIINFPEQHINNGILKHSQTRQNYKKCVRIIKEMKVDMKQENTISSQISSFGLESLLWNVPDSHFKGDSSLGIIFKQVLNFLSSDVSKFHNYKEANGIKPLFVNINTEQQYKQFLSDLKIHYQYVG